VDLKAEVAMIDAIKQFAALSKTFAGGDGVAAGQLFGKACLKVHGKAFIAQQHGLVVFKLADPHHAKALSLAGAQLWDPSGKGRPMKDWVALPASASKAFKALAQAALDFVRSQT
jgi:hypothetical protein